MLTPYYDKVFPANEKQVNFIVSYLKKAVLYWMWAQEQGM